MYTYKYTHSYMHIHVYMYTYVHIYKHSEEGEDTDDDDDAGSILPRVARVLARAMQDAEWDTVCCCSLMLQCVVAVSCIVMRENLHAPCRMPNGTRCVWQYVLAVCCCSVLLRCVASECYCSVLLYCVVAVCCSVLSEELHEPCWMRHGTRC